MRRCVLALCLALACSVMVWFSDVLWSPSPGTAVARAQGAGLAPTNCPKSSVHSVGSQGAAWVGNHAVRAWSIWQGSQATLDVGGGDAHGLQQKVFWRVRRTLHQVVTLRGWNLRTGSPTWFHFADQGAGTQPYAPKAVLDPRYASADPQDPTWPGYASVITVPSAGCYILFAQWRTGSWAVPFAAGAVVP
jgi:hypothetical protein